jgi:hypothetical protein
LTVKSPLLFFAETAGIAINVKVAVLLYKLLSLISFLYKTINWAWQRAVLISNGQVPCPRYAHQILKLRRSPFPVLRLESEKTIEKSINY